MAPCGIRRAGGCDVTGPDERLGPIIRSAIAGFVATLDRNPSANDVTLSDLAKSLDRLVAVYFETVEVDRGDDEAPRREHSDYKTTYARIGRAYPELGYYLHAWPDGALETKECDVGDAIDDLADIFGDLCEVTWYLERSLLADAIWHYRFGYQVHWGRHLHSLRYYLYSGAVAAW